MSGRSPGSRFLRFAVVAILAVAAIVTGSVFALFPGERHLSAALPAVSDEEAAQTLAALKPPKRVRPLIAIIGGNEGSETTDYLVPYGVLKRSDVADVYALGIRPGPVKLMPALTIVPELTAAAFDRRFPEGADYVIVPAMHIQDDPAVLGWIRAQREHGATVVGVCAGALVVAKAGLLRGRHATTHWFRLEELHSIDPTIIAVPDRRYVADRGVVTTTGVSASLPISLKLVEAIAGRARAEALAAELGAPDWGAAHNSGAFRLSRGDIWNFAVNLLSVWAHESAGIPVAAGVDEVALAFTADAYSGTHLASVLALAADRVPLAMKHGLRLVPDGVQGARVDFELPVPPGADSARALDVALAGIRARYGAGSVDVMELELEYPGRR